MNLKFATHSKENCGKKALKKQFRSNFIEKEKANMQTRFND